MLREAYTSLLLAVAKAVTVATERSSRSQTVRGKAHNKGFDQWIRQLEQRYFGTGRVRRGVDCYLVKPNYVGNCAATCGPPNIF
jgi:hypothetical protein